MLLLDKNDGFVGLGFEWNYLNINFDFLVIWHIFEKINQKFNFQELFLVNGNLH